MGAAVFVRTSNGTEGNKRWVEGTLTASASYATGGDTVDVDELYGLSYVSELWVKADTDNDSNFTAELAGTRTAPLLKLYGGTATQVTSTTDVSAFAVTARFYGT